MIKLNVLIDKLIWLGTLALFCSFYILNSASYSRLALFAILVFLGVLIVVRYIQHFPIYWHAFHNLVLLFLLFCFSSYFWSINYESTLIQSFVIFELFLCTSLLYTHYIKKENTTPLINIIIFGGGIVALYSFAFYGLDNMKTVLETASQLENSFSNINSLGMLMAVSSVCTVYQLLFDKWKWYHLFLLPMVIVLAATGSRTALIGAIFGSSIVFFFRYSSKNWVVSIISYTVVAVFLLIAFRFLLELSLFDGVNKRMETLINLFTGQGNVDNSATLRTQMIHIGIEQFKKTPFLGTGIGTSGEVLNAALGYRTYLHNNYAELLATVGLIGTFLYYLLFLYPAWHLFKQRKYNLPNTYLCLALIATLLLMDYGTVSYYIKSIYFYIMLFFIQVKINQRTLKGKNYEISKQIN